MRLLDMPHPYARSKHSGAGNCVCGMPDAYRSHQPRWWRITHKRPWR